MACNLSQKNIGHAKRHRPLSGCLDCKLRYKYETDTILRLEHGNWTNFD